MALIARFLACAVSQGVQATLLWYQAQLVYRQYGIRKLDNASHICAIDILREHAVIDDSPPCL